MDETLVDLGAALAAGLIVGLERGWAERELPEGGRAAGLRTFAIVGFGGGVAAAVEPALGSAPIALFLLGVLVLAVAGYLRGDGAYIGFTTEAALIVTALLGAAAGADYGLAAIGGAVVIALLLNQKALLHGWLERFKPAEIAAFLQILLIAIVVPPFLPDRTIDPWEALNPAQVWWLVVLVAGMSFLGYVAVRIAGTRVGTLLTGLFGGLASSTALTMLFARQAREAPAAAPALAAGVMVAWLVMVGRIAVLAAAIAPPLLFALWAPLAAAAAVALAAGLWLRRSSAERPGEAPPLGNPLDLWSTLKVVLLIVAVLILSKVMEAELGVAGLYLLAALSGLADVDAITLSAAERTRGGLDPTEGAAIVLLAAGVNTLAKAGLATALGGRAMAVRILPAAVAMLLAAGAAFAFVALTAGS